MMIWAALQRCQNPDPNERGKINNNPKPAAKQ